MVAEALLDISRRKFLAAGGLTVAAACFAPRLKKQGKSMPEVVAAKPGARYDAV